MIAGDLIAVVGLREASQGWGWATYAAFRPVLASGRVPTNIRLTKSSVQSNVQRYFVSAVSPKSPSKVFSRQGHQNTPAVATALISQSSSPGAATIPAGLTEHSISMTVRSGERVGINLFAVPAPHIFAGRVAVASVEPGLTASRAGIEAGDILHTVGGHVASFDINATVALFNTFKVAPFVAVVLRPVGGWTAASASPTSMASPKSPTVRKGNGGSTPRKSPGVSIASPVPSPRCLQASPDPVSGGEDKPPRSSPVKKRAGSLEPFSPAKGKKPREASPSKAARNKSPAGAGK